MADDIQIKKIVKVVVLGDIGRSPRMQYHALSLAENGYSVIIIGYMETSPLPNILAHQDISIHKLYPLVLKVGPKVILYAMKTLWLVVSLFLTLLISGRCDYLLCQNPPAIPTLPVCKLYCLIMRSKLIIDWHNYAFSIMAMSLSDDHFLVRITKFIEENFGRTSDKNMCVTYAMKKDLLQNWNIDAKVLYDRPPKIFHPLSVSEKHDWFKKISKQYPDFGESTIFEGVSDTETAFTNIVDGYAVMKKERPGLLFSSTSWTPDEDFAILLTALQMYETTHEMTKKLPNLICVITGKGPMKEHYIRDIHSRSWQHVKVITPWLEAADYPKMVGSADLGVCLHTSSSGLDLPMKVVDMFGAGLPVCAYDFKCLKELVRDGVNGYTYKTSDDLAKRIISWFENFPSNGPQNNISEEMKKEIAKFADSKWEENWNLRVRHFFNLE